MFGLHMFYYSYNTIQYHNITNFDTYHSQSNQLYRMLLVPLCSSSKHTFEIVGYNGVIPKFQKLQNLTSKVSTL